MNRWYDISALVILAFWAMTSQAANQGQQAFIDFVALKPVASGGVTVVVTNGMIRYYTLADVASGYALDSFGNKTGTVTRVIATNGVDGKTCAYFSGSSTSLVTTASYLGVSTNSYSITLWAKTVSYNNNGQPAMWAQGVSASDFMGGFWQSLYILQDGPAAGYLSAVTPKTNEWVFLCFIRDVSGPLLYLWVNGTNVANAATTGHANVDIIDNFSMGADGGAHSYPYQGSEQYIRVFNRALTTNEIITIRDARQ